MLLMMAVIVGSLFTIIALLKYRHTVRKNPFHRFLAILTLGAISSMIPWGILGLFLGWPAVVVGSVLVTTLMDD